MQKLLNAFLLFFLISAPARAGETWLKFEPATVTLSGAITLEDYYGAPNYGESPETDAKETAIILVLDQPVNVRGKKGDDLNGEDQTGVKRVQLVLPLAYENCTELSGKYVAAKGTLFTATNGHHRTRVLMHVDVLKGC